jgi:hypothetical protein
MGHEIVDRFARVLFLKAEVPVTDVSFEAFTAVKIQVG